MSFYGVITQLSQQNLWTLQLCMGMHSLSRACIRENISISASSNIIQSLSLKVSGLNPNWANNFNGWMITHYFLLHQELEDKYDRIPQEHQWNMDQKAIQLGGEEKNDGDKFIFTCHQKEPYKIGSNNLQLVTIIECVYVAGVAMPLSFILMDGPKPDTQRLLNESILRWQVFMKFWLFLHILVLHSLQMAGLTEICEQQFMDCFISLAMSKCVCDKLIFLNYDCHHSHKTVDVQWVMFHKNVVLTAFPSKTTHKTQPLDVKIFSAVQNWWSYRCDKHVAEGITINQYNAIHKYL